VSTANKEKRKRYPDGFRIMQGKQEFITYNSHSSLRVWPSDAAACTHDTHYHSAVEIFLALQGEAEYTLPQEAYRVSAGQILIVPSNCPHAMTHREDTKRYMIFFEPHIFNSLRDISILSGHLEEPIYLTDESPLYPEARELLMQVVDICTEQQPMWNSRCYSLLVRLYAALGRQWMAQDEGILPKPSSIDSEIMNSALSFISQHYTECLRLDDAASFTGFSKYYFSRAFKKFFKISFTEYLCRCRLDAAVDLLTHTSLPIRQVAEKSGFGSVATFNRLFRAAHACTPTRYRALYGGS